MNRNLLFFLAAMACGHAATPAPVIFPRPQEMTLSETGFTLDASVRILVPAASTADDLLLARELMAELSDHFGVAIPMERVATVPASGRAIVMGAATNPLVRQLGAARGVTVSTQTPGPEGYVLRADAGGVLIAGSDEPGAFYGLQSLRQLIRKEANGVVIRGAVIRDWPYKPFRGVKVYLPGRDHIGFFKRFVRDFMALNKFNQLILEMNAAMRFDRHPELNAGWIEFGRNLISTRRDRPDGPKGEGTDSTHHDTADGAVLEPDEVAELVQWARKYHIDVIPEVPSLTHSYYLLTRHRELAEMPDAEWPDAYCPSNPKSYDLLFDVLDEYIGVMKPRMMHLGHDEWRVRLGACPLCRNRDPRDLFIDDLNKIHDWLTARNVGVMIWGDHLIEELRGKNGVYDMTATSGLKYQRPGGLAPEMVQQRVPKDIVISNWFWQDGLKGQGEGNDNQLAGWGFRQIYGNFEPHIQNWSQRSARASVLGGAPSAWAATTEFNLGKDLMYQFLGCANLLWSKHEFAEPDLTAAVQAMMPGVRQRLGGRTPFSALGDPQAAVKLPLAGAAAARLQSAAVTFEVGDTMLNTATGSTSAAVAIGRDVSSLVFLHACEKRARNSMSYRLICDFEDTADLLGHYEVRYDDGFVATIPVRYGVNILEQSWTAASRARSYCYLADPVELDGGHTFFAFEWTNPRLGKAIKTVTFKGSSAFKGPTGQPLGDNAVLWKALSVVKPRPGPGTKSTTED